MAKARTQDEGHGTGHLKFSGLLLRPTAHKVFGVVDVLGGLNSLSSLIVVQCLNKLPVALAAVINLL